MAERRLVCIDMGIVPYRAALDLQERLICEIAQGVCDDHLIFLEHPAVVTVGRSATDEDILAAERLRSIGIDVVEISRGGQLTYHGPGQIVGYPLLHLARHERDLHQYVRNVEQALIEVLRDIGGNAHRVSERTGVWVDQMKVASIGVAVRRWVTWHGFALNVTTDLHGFRNFSPCGLSPEAMGSLEAIGLHVERQRLVKLLAGTFGTVFERDVGWGETISS